MKKLFFLLFCSQHAMAIYPIQRTYLNTRTAGMGNTFVTTGLYDQNFFGNPARSLDNPETRFTIFELSAFSLSSDAYHFFQQINDLQTKNFSVKDFENMLGKDIYGRVQIVLPAYYLAPNEIRKWSMGVGLIGSFYTDTIARKSASFITKTDASVTLVGNYGRIFYLQNPLKLGITGKISFNGAVNTNLSVIDFLDVQEIARNVSGGSAKAFSIDIGGQYTIVSSYKSQLNVGLSINNLIHTSSTLISRFPNRLPTISPRFSTGISYQYRKFYFLEQPTIALEYTEWQTGLDDSFWKHLHISTEAKFSVLAARLGLNQGYPTVGFSLWAHYFTLDLAFMTEELGLNAGVNPSKRFSLAFGFHI